MTGNQALPPGRHNAVLAQLGDREPSSRLEAEAVIEGIRAKKGYLDPDVLRSVNSMVPEHRDYVLGLVNQMKETEAAYTTSISEQLYSSKYRFLYEVVQNADDSHYYKVENTSSQPFLRFIVTPKTFTIETNEDGFNRRNVEAICATGKSSKKNSVTEEYTGEKGFGFKSVFSIADEVRVQSGLWSFRFKHSHGDDGLGMVTPLDAAAEVLPPDITTRITLHLTPKARGEYARLLEAIADMPDTTLFFLRKLAKISVETTHLDTRNETVSIQKLLSDSGSTVHIHRSRTVNGEEQTDASLYHKVRHAISGLPEDDRRRDQQAVWVDLAFPVDPETRQPKLCTMGQHVFAYLPVQRLPQLQFLIQSDFITSANRESVVDCDWNDAICRGVVAAFATAVKTFAAAGHPLRHSWLAFLPTMPMEKPWKTMYTSIVARLKPMAIFETWELRRFKRAVDLRQLPPYCLFEGQPILNDLSDEIYVAPEYGSAHGKALADLGLEIIDWDHIIARVRMDLVKKNSRIRSRDCDSPWFEAFAALCSLLLASKHSTVQILLRKQPLIPLTSSSQWTGAPGMGGGGLAKVYFPTVGAIPIPTDISLPLLNRAATIKTKVRDFYTTLGVEICPKATVLAKIRDVHLSGEKDHDLESHLRYLFYNHDRPSDLTSWLLVPTDDGSRSFDWRFYFASEAPYSMDRLLARDTRERNGMRCSIISTAVLNLEPANILANNWTWRSWLQEATKARDHPPLTRRTVSGIKLSTDLSYVLKYNPSKFLGTLKAHWDEYQRDASQIKGVLKNKAVLCRSAQALPLRETYLPTSEVLERLRELQVADVKLPILQLPDGDLDEALYREWRFLEEFGVRSKPDLPFYKSVLDILAAADGTTIKQAQSLYRSMAQLATVEDHQDLRTFFDGESRIRSASGWVRPGNCVWHGPKILLHTIVLKTCYPEDIYLENFFTTTLNIKNATLQTVLDELLVWLQEGPGSHSLSETCKAYEYLDLHARTDEELQNIRMAFKDKTLVMDRNSTWHCLHTCYWNSPSPLAGYVDLRSIYPNLESFFTRKMKVKKVSPAMLIREVKKMADHKDPQIRAIRDRLIEIGTIVSKGDMDADAGMAVQELLKVKFLPKCSADGSLTLVGAGDDFAILDHVRYGQILASHGILLNFGIHETQLLHVMFQKLGLTSRYLSMAVLEQSNAGDESVRDPELTRQLQARAYALYCCAAKHKSRKALRNDQALFDSLVELDIYTTDTLTTDLVLELKDGPLKVRSDRAFIHHAIVDGKLRIYVPQNLQDRRVCRRSHLPKLLADITGGGPAALYDISNIVSCSIEELYDILVERDISDVSWITKPILDLERLQTGEGTMIIEDHAEIHSPSATSSVDTIERETSVSSISASSTSASSRSMVVSVPVVAINDRSTHDRDVAALEAQRAYTQQSRYRQLLERLIAIAHRTDCDVVGTFDDSRTFGGQGTDDFVYNRRIGAAGEAFVYEWLSALNLPQFSLANWQSTIRGEVSVHPRYTDVRDWLGRETTDFVYVDRTGRLTKSLRQHCSGGFPSQIATDHDHASHPIEYYLEVKSTPGQCSTRFYMSGGQYNRMEEMAQELLQGRMKVYVIMRVFSLTAASVDLNIFVDPLRFKGDLLDFEAKQWFVKTQ